MPPNEAYRPIVIKMKTDIGATWWEIREYCNDAFHKNILSKLPNSQCTSGIIMYTFNDKQMPVPLFALTAGGIIGLYATFVMLIARIVKILFGNVHRTIMFKDLPTVDRIFELCLDIYLVREAAEFELEEDLFARLIFLFRSPETMIKFTRLRGYYNSVQYE